ncbi:Hypothetical protein A7982_07282 [Minicystis rosea]|nr:Hypothetical protein A7982_07282 [Minicystis rosea]
MFKSIVRGLPVIVLSAGLLAGCGGRSVPMRDARAVLLASPQQEPELRAAIARAMQSKSFTAASETPGAIVAEYSKGRVSLRLKITYTTAEYKIAYVDSDGLNYQQSGPDGAPTISSRYDRIVRDLTAAIDDELGRPAREAKEEEEAQRRHELAVIEAERQKQADVIEAKRRARAEARDAVALERERDRQAALEQERIRAEASRPVVVRRGSRVVVEEPPPRVVVVREPSRPVAEPPPPPAPTCRGTLLEQGHPSTSLMFCDGVEQRCAVALLRAGHNPAHLIHCRGVEPVCAEASMRRGNNPASLIHCR